MTAVLPRAFREGERLEWVAQELQGPVIRPVIFRASEGATHARVGFGPEEYTVPLTELRRHVPAEAPDHVRLPKNFEPNWYLRPGKRTPIAELRDRLRRAHEHVRQTDEARSAAQDLADRADRNLQEARAALAAHVSADRAAADRVAAAIRAGKDAPASRAPTGAERDAAKRHCVAVEAAATKFTTELADARAAAREAHRQACDAARAIVVAIAEREGDELIRLEIEVENRRAALRALASFTPAGDQPTAITLPYYLQQRLNSPTRPPGSATALPWRALYERLVGGDADADLETDDEARPELAA